MLIAGDKTYGLSMSLFKIYPDAMYASRKTGFDLCTQEGQESFAKEATNHSVIILCSSLNSFNQTLLLNKVFEQCTIKKNYSHIICIGSTIDRSLGENSYLYKAEKKALKEHCNTFSTGSVWKKYPKVTYIGFGSLSNVAEKHPGRKCLDIDQAAEYIKWIVDQPRNVNINEISIDPMQDAVWYD